jgi:hypothetical protein
MGYPLKAGHSRNQGVKQSLIVTTQPSIKGLAKRLT